MPNVRLPVRKIKEVLRLKFGSGLSHRQIAHCCNVAHSTVREYLGRAAGAGVSWPLCDGTDDDQLERLLFPEDTLPSSAGLPLPDWHRVHTELRRKGVTLRLLWEEYRSGQSEGYGYSQFCHLYRAWAKKLNLSMRQVHKAGEKLFVDYAGQTVPIVDAAAKSVRTAQIFVAVLGASNYTFAEATWTQTLPDWIGSHVRAFDFFGSVPELIVPDNLKSGVSKTCRYDPEINPTYQEMAMHYGVAVIPARVRKPKDKAKAEVGVQIVERWILARLRNRTFFSLGELNTAIRELLVQLNNREFPKLKGESRRSLFDRYDKPALKPLPAQPYEYGHWSKPRVNIDYHVEVDKHFYSVPCRLVREEVDARLTASTVEIFHKSNRVASHPRSYLVSKATTIIEHMPKSHQEYGAWPPSRLAKWADEIGPNAAAVAEKILARPIHPALGYRQCLGLLRLEKEHTRPRLEAACKRALAFQTESYQSVKTILHLKLDQQEILPVAELPVIEHSHIRGSDYYQ